MAFRDLATIAAMFAELTPDADMIEDLLYQRHLRVNATKRESRREYVDGMTMGEHEAFREVETARVRRWREANPQRSRELDSRARANRKVCKGQMPLFGESDRSAL